jgi:hypothetical protein
MRTKEKTDEKISLLVSRGLLPSGAIVAYGTFNSIHVDELSNLLFKKGLSNIKVITLLVGLAKDIDKANKIIQEVVTE